MTSPRNPSSAFSSFRILGKKAQLLLQKARRSVLQPDERKAKTSSLPKADSLPTLVMHLSTGSVVRACFVILGFLLGAWILMQLSDKVLLLLIAAFIAVVIDSGVAFLERLHVPRAVGILLHYVIGLCILIFLIVSIVPLLANQLQQIAIFVNAEANVFLADPRIHLPLLTDDVNLRLTSFAKSTLEQLSIRDFTDALDRASGHLSAIAGGSWEFVKSFTGSLATIFGDLIIVLVLAFFMQNEKERILKWFRGFLPERYRPYVNRKLELIYVKLGQWARGEAILMFAIFTLTLIALLILRMPYALTLAVLAGFCEFIPAVGPLFAAIPAVLLGFTQGGLMWGIVLVAVYYVIQWCENNLLVPLIMKRAVGLSSIAILFALLVGISFPATIHPMLGVMLAIPATTIVAIFLEDLNKEND
ncbi:MAG: AI-2E family transporter [Candidatus Peregrinibacteria bacterium]